MLTALYNSIIRTGVPIVVASAATYGAKVGLDVDSAALSAVLGGLVGSGYYTVARLLETRYPKLTWLLGSSTQPTTYSYDGSFHKAD